MNIFEHIDKKAIVGFAVILAALAALFFYWLSGSPKEQGSLTEVQTSSLNATLGRELLTALGKLKSTTLDTSVFSDPVFESLTDFGVEIAAQPIGRRNPFAAWSAAAGKSTAALKPPAAGSAKAASPSTQKPKAPVGGFDSE